MDKRKDIVIASQLGWVIYDTENEAKKNWKGTGWCDICKRWKINLNRVELNSPVAKFFNLDKPSWICEDCWDKYEHETLNQPKSL